MPECHGGSSFPPSSPLLFPYMSETGQGLAEKIHAKDLGKVCTARPTTATVFRRSFLVPAALLHSWRQLARPTAAAIFHDNPPAGRPRPSWRGRRFFIVNMAVVLGPRARRAGAKRAGDQAGRARLGAHSPPLLTLPSASPSKQASAARAREQGPPRLGRLRPPRPSPPLARSGAWSTPHSAAAAAAAAAACVGS